MTDIENLIINKHNEESNHNKDFNSLKQELNLFETNKINIFPKVLKFALTFILLISSFTLGMFVSDNNANQQIYIPEDIVETKLQGYSNRYIETSILTVPFESGTLLHVYFGLDKDTNEPILIINFPSKWDDKTTVEFNDSIFEFEHKDYSHTDNNFWDKIYIPATNNLEVTFGFINYSNVKETQTYNLNIINYINNVK